MLITDGAPYTYEKIFKEYNWPNIPVKFCVDYKILLSRADVCHITIYFFSAGSRFYLFNRQRSHRYGWSTMDGLLQQRLYYQFISLIQQNIICYDGTLVWRKFWHVNQIFGKIEFTWKNTFQLKTKKSTIISKRINIRRKFYFSGTLLICEKHYH